MADFGTSAEPGGKVWESTKLTGTATASYPGTPQARWLNAHLLQNKVLIIHNTHSTNTIVFKLVIQDVTADDVKHEYPSYGDTDAQVIEANSTAYLNLPETFYAVEAYLKSASGATYACMATGQYI